MSSKNSGNSEAMEDRNKEIMERLALLQQVNEAAKKAKRWRMELTSSPPERPPTPGEARLGDWM